MKKVLLVVALLLLATPVFAADVTITQSQGTWSAPFKPVTIGYTGAAEANSIRGFALVLTVDSGALLDNIRDFNRGESTKPGGGYGIFPGKFRDFINAASPNWVDINYNPLAPWGDLNSQSGNNYMRMVVELGTLFVEPNSPGTAGTLFTVDVNKNTVTENDCNMCIQIDATRGGVVKKDAAGAAVDGLGCFKVSFPPSGVAVPNLVGMNRVAAITALTSIGLVKGVEANVAPTVAGQLVNNVNNQKTAPGTIVPLGTAVDFNTVNYPIKWMNTTNSLYVNWVLRNRPACWAYPRQCKGGADGKKQISYWVGSNNLTILKAAFNKAESVYNGGAVSGTTSLICASFDHKKQISYWVGSNCLGILKANFNKAESAIPLCATVPATGIPTSQAGFSADVNYWYWCIPTTGGACPTGQYCAPAGVCPNTP